MALSIIFPVKREQCGVLLIGKVDLWGTVSSPPGRRPDRAKAGIHPKMVRLSAALLEKKAIPFLDGHLV